jgi:hypothetical protein
VAGIGVRLRYCFVVGLGALRLAELRELLGLGRTSLFVLRLDAREGRRPEAGERSHLADVILRSLWVVLPTLLVGIALLVGSDRLVDDIVGFVCPVVRFGQDLAALSGRGHWRLTGPGGDHPGAEARHGDERDRDADRPPGSRGRPWADQAHPIEMICAHGVVDRLFAEALESGDHRVVVHRLGERTGARKGYGTA